eukprot:2891800-Rhodomonas_salina.1
MRLVPGYARVGYALRDVFLVARHTLAYARSVPDIAKCTCRLIADLTCSTWVGAIESSTAWKRHRRCQYGDRVASAWDDRMQEDNSD